MTQLLFVPKDLVEPTLVTLAVRHKLVNIALILVSAILFITTVASAYRAVDVGWQPIMLVHGLAALLTLVVTLLRHKLNFHLRTWFLILLFFVAGVLSLISWGLVGFGTSLLVIGVILATALLGFARGVAVAVVSGLVIVAIGVLAIQHQLDFPMGTEQLLTSVWLVHFVGFSIVSAMGVSIVGCMDSAVFSTAERLKETNWQLGETQNELLKASDVDDLTGLLNRRRFFELAESEFDRFARYQEPFSIIYFNIDGFKEINDHAGREIGDTVIQGVAADIKFDSRSCDVSARLGGDEFAVLLPNTNQEKARIMVERVRKDVRASRFARDIENQVTVSAGVSQARPADRSLNDLIQRVDAALYLAKTNGRDRVEVAQL